MQAELREEDEAERWRFTLLLPVLGGSVTLLSVHRIVLHAVRSANSHSTQRGTRQAAALRECVRKGVCVCAGLQEEAEEGGGRGEPEQGFL